jgi:hypothetical protein
MRTPAVGDIPEVVRSVDAQLSRCATLCLPEFAGAQPEAFDPAQYDT